MKSSLLLIALLPVLVLVACGGATIGIGGGGVGMGVSTGPDAYRREIDDWHRARIERLMKDDGWLSLVGLFPLSEGMHTFGSADDNAIAFPASAPAHAGTIVVALGTVHLTAADGVAMTHDGEPVTDIDLDTDRDGRPTEIVMGTFKFHAIDRPGSLYLRVKDAASPVRASFAGIDRYPVRRTWRVKAHWVPYDPPRLLTIPNIVGFTETVECRGALEFRMAGKGYRLEPMSEGDDDLFIVFGDATNQRETYGGGRFVYVPVPDAAGWTVIDFNKAYNPPCVFTHYATCPLPHAANVLPFPVKAGEKAWNSESHTRAP